MIRPLGQILDPPMSTSYWKTDALGNQNQAKSLLSTYNMPLFVFVVVGQQLRLSFGSEIQRFTVEFPRLEAEVAPLIVKRVPCNVDRTVGDGMFEQRPPEARPIAVDSNVVGLWRGTPKCLLLCAAPHEKNVNSLSYLDLPYKTVAEKEE